MLGNIGQSVNTPSQVKLELSTFNPTAIRETSTFLRRNSFQKRCSLPLVIHQSKVNLTLNDNKTMNVFVFNTKFQGKEENIEVYPDCYYGCSSLSFFFFFFGYHDKDRSLRPWYATVWKRHSPTASWDIPPTSISRAVVQSGFISCGLQLTIISYIPYIFLSDLMQVPRHQSIIGRHNSSSSSR